MGYRLHYAKIYKVEYSTNASFSHLTEEVNELLQELCPNIVTNNDDNYCADELEISKEEIEEAIRKLHEERSDFDDDHYDLRPTWMQERDISYSDIAEFLQDALDENSDPDNDYVKFAWF